LNQKTRQKFSGHFFYIFAIMPQKAAYSTGKVIKD